MILRGFFRPATRTAKCTFYNYSSVRTVSSPASPIPGKKIWDASGRAQSERSVRAKLRHINEPFSSTPSSDRFESPPDSNSTTFNTDDIELDFEESTHTSRPNTLPTPHEFSAHRKTMKKSFPAGWGPPRKLSREAMDGVRALHQHDPNMFSTPVLAERFKISPEAVRRILRSKWEPDEKRKAKMAEKEQQVRKAWIEQKSHETRLKRLASRRPPPEMFMDVESDKEFIGEDVRVQEGDSAVAVGPFSAPKRRGTSK